MKGLFNGKDSIESTILSIDVNMTRLNSRLRYLLGNLRIAANGEQSECESEKGQESIPTASIDSIIIRLGDAHSIVSTIESYMKRFHTDYKK